MAEGVLEPEVLLKIEGDSRPSATPIVNLRCPTCNHVGAFHGFPNVHDIGWHQRVPEPERSASFEAGVRMCPNNQCRTVVFVVLKSGQLFKSYPPEVIDFDSTDLPPSILATLEEAIKSHSVGCYKASALMIRRVLEELCEDKKASGKDLKARISHLGSSIIIPQELLDAADELRLLGNDAAHVKAKAYDDIGKEEATLAIELAKKLLEAAYQYSSLVSKLKALKK
jgi:Domain of unknown function (DUF4145)